MYGDRHSEGRNGEDLKVRLLVARLIPDNPNLRNSVIVTSPHAFSNLNPGHRFGLEFSCLENGSWRRKFSLKLKGVYPAFSFVTGTFRSVSSAFTKISKIMRVRFLKYEPGFHDLANPAHERKFFLVLLNV
jgi:hypothetical protein